MREGLSKMRMQDYSDSEDSGSVIGSESEETEYDGQEHDIFYRYIYYFLTSYPTYRTSVRPP